MRLDQVGMPLRLRDPVAPRQRHSVTEDRFNAPMDWIGKRVRVIRERQKMSRATLAKCAGMSPTSLSDLELGRQTTTTKLHKLASCLGTTVEHLETNAPDVRPAITLTSREVALIQAYRSAGSEGRAAIEGAATAVSKHPFFQAPEPPVKALKPPR